MVLKFGGFINSVCGFWKIDAYWSVALEIYVHAIYEQVSSSKFLWASLWKVIFKFSFCIKKHEIKQPVLFTFAESFWMRSVCFLKEQLKT